MAKVSENIHDIKGIRLRDAFVVIVRTEWNADVNDKLEEGCAGILKKAGVKFKVISVPGAFEIAFAIKMYWSSFGKKSAAPDAFIALGCVLRGDTPHFDYVCKGVTDGVVQLNLQLPVPVIFGVLTVDNQQQADDRIGGVHGHKGAEAASTAIKMISLSRSLQKKKA